MKFLYIITNLINGKQYVGQAYNPLQRWMTHQWCSRSSPLPLYRAMRRYGISNFRFEVVAESFDLESINEAEIDWIEALNSYRNGYNLTIGGEGSTGCPATEERKLKIAQSKIGKKRSPETIEKMRIGNLGKKYSQETQEKKRQAMLKRGVSQASLDALRMNQIKRKGVPISEEKKQRLREVNLGKKLAPETIAKIISKNTGKKRSEEIRKKLSKSATLREEKRRESKFKNQPELSFG